MLDLSYDGFSVLTSGFERYVCKNSQRAGISRRSMSRSRSGEDVQGSQGEQSLQQTTATTAGKVRQPTSDNTWCDVTMSCAPDTVFMSSTQTCGKLGSALLVVTDRSDDVTDSRDDVTDSRDDLFGMFALRVIQSLVGRQVLRLKSYYNFFTVGENTTTTTGFVYMSQPRWSGVESAGYDEESLDSFQEMIRRKLIEQLASLEMRTTTATTVKAELCYSLTDLDIGSVVSVPERYREMFDVCLQVDLYERDAMWSHVSAADIKTTSASVGFLHALFASLFRK